MILYLIFGYCLTDIKPLKAKHVYDKFLFDFNYFSRRGPAVSFCNFNSRLGRLTGDRSVADSFVENTKKERGKIA